MLEVNDFSIVEVRVIQSLWQLKAIEYIANILDRSYTDVERKVHELNKTHKVKLFQRPSFERKLKQKNKEVNWAQSQLKVKQLKVKDTSGLISVRIDAKTVVFVKAGSDIDKIKARYQEHLKPITIFSSTHSFH